MCPSSGVITLLDVWQNELQLGNSSLVGMKSRNQSHNCAIDCVGRLSYDYRTRVSGLGTTKVTLSFSWVVYQFSDKGMLIGTSNISFEQDPQPE